MSSHNLYNSDSLLIVSTMCFLTLSSEFIGRNPLVSFEEYPSYMRGDLE